MPSSQTTLDVTRQMLFSANIRFGSSTQVMKREAIRRIAKQILEAASEPMTVAQIQAEVIKENIGFSVTRSDIEHVLTEVALKRQEFVGAKAVRDLYELRPELRQEVHLAMAEAERKIDRILRNVFAGSTTAIEELKEPFLDALARVFYELGSRNAEVLLGKNEITAYPFLPAIAAKTAKKYPQVSAQTLEAGLVSFFESSDPEYNQVKWNFSQHYYVSVALGLDKAQGLLSRDIFEASTLFLDTNVAFAALQPLDPLHNSFEALYRACAELNIRFRVCQISIDELNSWVSTQQELIRENVLEQIPLGLESEVDWIIFHIYLHKKRKFEVEPPLDTLLEEFDLPVQKLEDRYGIELDDDQWFDNAQNYPHVKRLAQTIATRSGHKGRLKNSRAAMHDAQMLHWIEHFRSTSRTSKVWLLTADQNLPLRASIAKGKPVIITMDALLQWLSPVIGQNGDLQDVFSDLIRSKLLPQERFLSEQDFRIFAHMDMQCRNLPEKDVRECIGHIREEAPQLDVSKSDDREKLTTIVQGFMLDPTRAYLTTVDEYRAALGAATAEKEEIEARYKIMIDDFMDNHQRVLEEQEKQAQSAVLKMQRENEILRQQLTAKEEEDTKRHGRWQRITRVIVSFIALIIVVGGICLSLGEGENWWQKLANSWDFVAAILGLFVLLASMYLLEGDKRLLRLFVEPDKATRK